MRRIFLVCLFLVVFSAAGVTSQNLGECGELETLEEACNHCSGAEWQGWYENCEEGWCIVWCSCYGEGSEVAAGTCGSVD
ncbi:MAG: hypothetical protein V3R83_09655 [Gammaproteobacteria bacterium]